MLDLNSAGSKPGSGTRFLRAVRESSHCDVPHRLMPRRVTLLLRTSSEMDTTVPARGAGREADSISVAAGPVVDDSVPAPAGKMAWAMNMAERSRTGTALAPSTI